MFNLLHQGLSPIGTVPGTAAFDRLWRSLLAMDRDRFFTATSGLPTLAPRNERAAERWPGLNVWRDGDSIVAEAELPGFRMDEIEVTAHGDTFMLRGQRQSAVPDGATPLRIERAVQSFERSFRLPVAIDADRVEATLTDGVLRLTMPLPQSAAPRRVQIRPHAQPSSTGSGTNPGTRAAAENTSQQIVDQPA